MKTAILSLSLGMGLFGLAESAQSASFTFQQSGISSQSQIVAPVGATNLVKAVDVGSANSSTVNGITFAADTVAAATVVGTPVFSGNGYTAKASDESSGGDGSADFTQTTINTGSSGYIHGDPISLIPNTDYVFQIFLSDYHNNRGEGFTYTLNSAPSVVDITASRYITQNLGNVNLYQVSFNSGADTSFTWALDPGSSTGQHDGKLSGYALYSSAAAVPEPSTYALLGVGALALILAYRRKTA